MRFETVGNEFKRPAALLNQKADGFYLPTQAVAAEAFAQDGG
jgi:hypothetical protein